MFGYLSILYKAPFVNSPLKSQLAICHNLCSLVNRIQKDVFPVDVKGKFCRCLLLVKKTCLIIRVLKELERIQNEQQKRKNTYWHSFVSLFESKSKQTLAQSEEWQTRKKQILAITLTASIMITYAFVNGLIKVDFVKTDH